MDIFWSVKWGVGSHIFWSQLRITESTSHVSTRIFHPFTGLQVQGADYTLLWLWLIVFPPYLFCDNGFVYHLHGPSLHAMDSCRGPTQSFPFHWRGGLVQVRVRTFTPLPQVTLQAENGVHLEKPPSTAVKKDHCPIKPGRPYRKTFLNSQWFREFIVSTDFNVNKSISSEFFKSFI